MPPFATVVLVHRVQRVYEVDHVDLVLDVELHELVLLEASWELDELDLDGFDPIALGQSLRPTSHLLSSLHPSGRLSPCSC